MQPNPLEKKQLIRVYIEIGKTKMKMKFPSNTKILNFEQYLKRTTKMAHTQAIFLFVKQKRKLVIPEKTLLDYAHQPKTQEELKNNPDQQKILNIVVRKTDAF